jgi:DNA polymerase-1
MNRFEKLDYEKQISRSVITSLSNEKILGANSFIKSLLEFRRSRKLHDTYITGVKEAIKYNGFNKIFVEYRLDGTVTGRLSNAGYSVGNNSMGISFHTLPRESKFNIRNYVVAPRGHKFITADMKSMELRVLAHLAKEKNMAKAFNERMDLHTYSASMTFGKPMDKVTKEERQIAKAVSFLTVYGGTEKTLAMKQGISFKKAKGIIEGWMAAFPGVPRYMEHIDDFIKRNKYAYTIFGRRRNLPNAASEAKYIREQAFRQGLNFTVQSSASDTLVCCMLGLHQELKKRKMQSKIVATVHDSLELIAPDFEVDETIRLLHYHMTEYPYIKENFGITFSVPLEIEVMVGDSFGSGEEYHIN